MLWAVGENTPVRLLGALLLASFSLMSCSALNGKIDFKSLRDTHSSSAKALLAWGTSTQGFGLVPVSTSISLTLTLTNSGTAKATGCSSPILSGTNTAEFMISTDGCATADLATAASCTVVVAVNPTSEGTKNASLTRTCTVGGTASTELTAESFKHLSSGPMTSGPMIAAGQKHSCVILADGSVKCWGANNLGQLGQDNIINVGTAASPMSGLSAIYLGTGRTATQIALGLSHTCAILDDGNVKCWGDNVNGKLGQGNTTPVGCGPGCITMANLAPINLGINVTATQIAAGASHTCAILNDGSVKCWGFNNNGQLGQSNTTTVGDSPGSPVGGLPSIDLGLNATALQIADGGSHTCALLKNLTVRCWGWNSSGQLGQDNLTNVGYSAATSVASLTPINLGTNLSPVRIAVGAEHSCAIFNNGAVKCWGDNGYGQLGQNSTTKVGCGNTNGCPNSAASISSIDLGTRLTATQIGSRDNHTCALLNDGSMKCWGQNDRGQLGQDSTTLAGDSPSTSVAALSPVFLGINKTATQIAVGSHHTCAVLNDGTIKCWGDNGYGQLGQDSVTWAGDGAGTPMTSLSSILGLL